MKLIIELDERQFKDIQRIASIQIRRRSLTCEQIIANGTPLPKGHGDLIDRDECLKMKMTDLCDKDGVTMYAVPTGNILRMKPVIKADKENKE